MHVLISNRVNKIKRTKTHRILCIERCDWVQRDLTWRCTNIAIVIPVSRCAVCARVSGAWCKTIVSMFAAMQWSTHSFTASFWIHWNVAKRDALFRLFNQPKNGFSSSNACMYTDCIQISIHFSLRENEENDITCYGIQSVIYLIALGWCCTYAFCFYEIVTQCFLLADNAP